MLEVARGAALTFIVAMASTVAAQAPPAAGDRALGQKLSAELGQRWIVRTTPTSPLVEASRATPQPRAPDFDVRVARETRRAHAREPELTVDVAKGTIHLAGRAGDCDHVTEAAGHFAAIPGVDTIDVDTRCDPRQP